MDRQANVLELRSDIARYNELAPGAGLAAYLEQVALVADVDSMDRDRSEAATLITLHSAKGLEYPVVFIAGVEEASSDLAGDRERIRRSEPGRGGAPPLLCRHYSC